MNSERYESAKKMYEKIGVDTEAAIKRLKDIPYLNDEYKSIIDNNVKRLESHAKELFVLIDKTLIDLSSLSVLLTKINEITDIFDKMRGVIKEKKDKYYDSLGIKEWKIESNKYWDIINSYTIKKERMIANSVLTGENAPNVDINIEEGADSGDFTLF